MVINTSTTSREPIWDWLRGNTGHPLCQPHALQSTQTCQREMDKHHARYSVTATPEPYACGCRRSLGG